MLIPLQVEFITNNTVKLFIFVRLNFRGSYNFTIQLGLKFVEKTLRITVDIEIDVMKWLPTIP